MTFERLLKLNSWKTFINTHHGDKTVGKSIMGSLPMHTQWAKERLKLSVGLKKNQCWKQVLILRASLSGKSTLLEHLSGKCLLMSTNMLLRLLNALFHSFSLFWLSCQVRPYSFYSHFQTWFHLGKKKAVGDSLQNCHWRKSCMHSNALLRKSERLALMDQRGAQQVSIQYKNCIC